MGDVQRLRRDRAGRVTLAPPPICACCRQPIGLVWRVTTSPTYVICGSGGCEQWVWAQGLRYADERRRPARHKHQCAACGGDLPRRTANRFRGGDREFCTLTCMQTCGGPPAFDNRGPA